MPNYTNLISISQTDGKCLIDSFITACTNVKLIYDENTLIDVSENEDSIEFAAIVHKDAFERYLDLSTEDETGVKWYKELTDDVKLVLVFNL